LEKHTSYKLQVAIGFCFSSQWLKNWHEIFKPIFKRINGYDRVIIFDSHLKTGEQSVPL